MIEVPKRYVSPDEDSARWLDVDHRAGDIVISSRSKHGTTWVQMMCALLIFRTAELPAPLSSLSPWLDWLVRPLPEVLADLERQEHRRFIKTHTPLDGLPLRRDVTYIVVARHPLDAAVSLYHQSANLDRQRLAELTGNVIASPRVAALDEWLTDWIGRHASPCEELDSLQGVMAHLTDAWMRRMAENVLLLHYADLEEDLVGQMSRLAERLAIDIPWAETERLAASATFSAMQGAPELAPNYGGVLIDEHRFFRRGSSGAAAEVLPPESLADYHRRVGTLGPPDLVEWLNRP